MKCDYCEKQATYSMGAILDKETIPIYACDEHRYVGLNRQRITLELENLKQRHKWR